jgi:hypothetical protein
MYWLVGFRQRHRAARHRLGEHRAAAEKVAEGRPFVMLAHRRAAQHVGGLVIIHQRPGPGLRGGVGPRHGAVGDRQQSIRVVAIHLHGVPQLLELAEALRRAGPFLGLAQGGQQQAREDRNDRNHHEELDKRETGWLAAMQFHQWTDAHRWMVFTPSTLKRTHVHVTLRMVNSWGEAVLYRTSDQRRDAGGNAGKTWHCRHPGICRSHRAR